MEIKNARTPGRSARAQSCEMEEVTCTIFPETPVARVLQGNANGIDDVAENRFGRLGFLLQRGVARAGGNAVRKYRDGQRFEIVGHAVVAAIQESARLRRALQHQRAARGHAERELLGVARAMHDFERVVVKAGVDTHLRDLRAAWRVRRLTSATGSSDCTGSSPVRLRRISRSVSCDG